MAAGAVNPHIIKHMDPFLLTQLEGRYRVSSDMSELDEGILMLVTAEKVTLFVAKEIQMDPATPGMTCFAFKGFVYEEKDCTIAEHRRHTVGDLPSATVNAVYRKVFAALTVDMRIEDIKGAAGRFKVAFQDLVNEGVLSREKINWDSFL